MKIYSIVAIASTVVVLTFSSCQQGSHKRMDNLAASAHQVVAEEIIQTTKYTYILVTEEEDEYWIAIERIPVEKEETYFWSVGTEMKNFKGTEANRTFESIYFVQDFTDQPITETGQASMPPQDRMPPQEMMAPQEASGKPQIPMKEGIAVTPAEGGITVGELFEHQATYNGKRVKIRGEVVKFSPQIMERNWVHIQDGTKDSKGNYDLTITTQSVVKAGDIVLFEGVVALEKDFGYGYFYPVIVEEAEVK